MGSALRRVKKNVAKHLRLIKGGKVDEKPDLGGCPACRDDYDLEHVVCCRTCHRKSNFSKVRDEHGTYQVCCEIRRVLCPSEEGPHHPAA